MNVTSFHVLGIPKSQGSTRAFVAKGRAYVASNHKQDFVVWRNALVEKAEREHEGEPFAGAELHAHFYLPIPKSRPKYLLDFRPHLKKPDLDKLTRALSDALVAAGVVTDDSVIWRMHVSKGYAAGTDKPGVQVAVYEQKIPNSPRQRKEKENA